MTTTPKHSKRTRADLLLVHQGLAATREQAQALILAGQVYSPSGRVLKPGGMMSGVTALEVREGLPYVSRGGQKLAHALQHFRLDLKGTTALDIGASTGGFTDCMLQCGTQKVYALDVGHGQIAYKLRCESRVVVMEGVNAHYPFPLPEPVDLATVDVSFISVTKVLPNVLEHLRPGSPIVALVKPQFEARRPEVPRGGVIKDPRIHAAVLARTILWVVNFGLRLRDLTPSPILGDAGNREFFLLLRSGGIA